MRVSLSSIGLTVALAFLPRFAPIAGASGGDSTAPRGSVPAAFEENAGQTAADVRFVTRQDDLMICFSPTEIVFGLGERGHERAPEAGSEPEARPRSARERMTWRRSAVRMRLVGANPSPQLTGLDPLPGESHYLIGSDPAEWRTHIRHYGRVAYRDVYPGIDLVFYSRSGRLEYDFEIQAGVDEGAIELAFDGMDQAAVDGGGDLVLRVPGGQLRHRRPTSLEGAEGSHRALATTFSTKAGGRFGLRVEGRDRSRRLRIDPELEWIRLPGERDDWARDVAVDREGNAYVTGTTYSTAFPRVGGMPPGDVVKGEAFVVKLNPRGGIIYSTFFGAASEYDVANGIVVDAQGQAVVTGATYGTIAEVSAAYPGKCAADPGVTGFLVKLAADGASFGFSTCLPADYGVGAALDPPAFEPLRGVTVAGGTANDDVFVGRYLLDGTEVYTRTWGGSRSDFARDVAVAPNGHAYVAGWANSFDLPGTAEGLQPTATRSSGFVGEFGLTGELMRATYLGGSGGMSGASGVAVDGSGNVHVTGWTAAADFPLANASRSELRGSPWGPVRTAFVTTLRANLRELVYSTFYAQSDVPVDGTIEYVYWEEGVKVAVDGAGSAYVIGWATTFNDATYFEGIFGWLAAFDPAGQPVRNQLLDLTVNGDQPYGVAVADNGDLYIVGHVDYRWGSDPSDSDVFIIRIPGAPGDEIDVLPSTTRWKAQRDATTDIEVDFTGPKDLKAYPDTQLEVRDPTGAILVDPALSFTLVSGDSDPAQYRFTWSGLKAVDGGPTWKQPDGNPLPAGDYTVRVIAKTADVRMVTSQPYSRISLVEVQSVELCSVTGEALEADPPVPQNDDERAAGVSRAERPGGGLRIFAESALPGGPVNDGVVVKVRIQPVLDVAVPVYLRAVDVADPDAAPPNPGEQVHDNLGSADLPATVEVPASAGAASAVLRVPHQPGDNMRLLASTSQVWLNEATAVPMSLVGEVRDGGGNVLVESGGGTTSSQLSKMLTVWRTLHLEIDSMGPEPLDSAASERNFVDGQVKSIQGYRDGAIRLVLDPQSPPGMDRLADGSLDADSMPTRGNGRFERGTIRLGNGERAQEFSVGVNGLEYVEAPWVEAGGQFVLRFFLLSVDGETALCGGHVISGSPVGGAFDLNPTAGSWSEAQANAVWLDIAGVRHPIIDLGPTRLNEDNVLVGTAMVGGDGKLPFHLTDDDQAKAPFEVDTSLLQDSDDPNENVFAAAYIRPRILRPGGPEDYVDTNTAAFNRNIECPMIDRVGGFCETGTEILPALTEGRDLSPDQSTNTCWLMYIQGAFQAGEAGDSDPDYEVDVKLGSTIGDSDRHGTLVYVEPLREAAGCPPIVVAHELGHQFGLDHAPDNPALMKGTCYRNGRYFLPQELRSIRAKGVQP